MVLNGGRCPVSTVFGCLLIMFYVSHYHLPTVIADVEHHCNTMIFMRGPDPNGMCGKSLSNVIELICGGLSNVNKRSAKNGKRDLQHSYRMKNKITGKGEQMSKLKLMTIRKRVASSFLEKRSHEDGLACECCYHSCSFYELSQYCIVPPKFPISVLGI